MASLPVSGKSAPTSSRRPHHPALPQPALARLALARITGLLSLLVSGLSFAAAPTDPFLRTPPAAQPAGLNSQPNQPGAPQPARTFGAPRFSSSGGVTRVVFDLPAGVRYTLTPTFSGLRLDVQGGSTILNAQRVPAPGSAVSEYTLTPDPVGGGQALLQTPFPLGGNAGWTASEATIASGGRVLIVNLGATLSGGADASVSGPVLAVAGPPAPAPTSPATGTLATGTPATGSTPLPTPPAATPSQLPPGDTARPLGGAALPTATPALPGSSDTQRVVAGVVGGTPGPSQALLPPRIGRNPGLTRLVLDLPPGTGFHLTPLPLGLRVDLSGVTPGQLTGAQGVSPELSSWSVAANLTGTSLTLNTPGPITLRSGWRDVLLPPVAGSSLSRLAIDVSPALADTSPLGRVALAPLKSSRGTMLAFSGNAGRPKVVLDPGHGGIDSGAIGQVVEKQVTLDVARRVRANLVAAGIDVIMTRDADVDLSDDKNTDLTMRAALGTGVAQLYVSIHVNSTDAASALKGYGIETWWNPNHPNSQALAQSIQQDVTSTTAAYSRGLKNIHSLAVLRLSHIPAALVEVGFTSHPVDGVNLKDNNYLDRLAYGIASGIRDALQAGLGANWR